LGEHLEGFAVERRIAGQTVGEIEEVHAGGAERRRTGIAQAAVAN
jgi:hypothetical protein